MTDEELNLQHNENCEIIARAISSIDFENAVEWNKVRIKIDDSNVYIEKSKAEQTLYEQFTGGKVK